MHSFAMDQSRSLVLLSACAASFAIAVQGCNEQKPPGFRGEGMPYESHGQGGQKTQNIV